jgi:hypothetical protein
LPFSKGKVAPKALEIKQELKLTIWFIEKSCPNYLLHRMLLEELVSIRWGFNLLCDNRKIRFDSDPFGSIFFRHFGYCSGTALNVADQGFKLHS